MNITEFRYRFVSDKEEALVLYRQDFSNLSFNNCYYFGTFNPKQFTFI